MTKATKKATKKTTKKTGYDIGRMFETARQAIAEDRSEYHGPRGNTKTGESIPCWNLCPGITCSPEACAHRLQEGCYALKNMLCHGYDIDKNAVLRAWVENTALAMNHLDQLEAILDEYFSSMGAPRFFRIHSAGDFFSIEYGAMWYRIAQRHPETMFLAFTKQWDVARAVPFDDLPNFSLVLSGWTGVQIPEDLRARYRCAWCYDGQEDRIPEDAIECPGNCDTCGLCWKLREIGRDTKFHKH